MSKNKFFIITTIGLLISNLIMIGFFLIHNPHKRPIQNPKQVIISKLNFDDQQIKEYEQIIEKHRTLTDQIDGQIRELKTEIYGLVGNDENSMRTDSLRQVLQVQIGRKERVHFDHLTDIMKICTKKQLPAFFNLMSEVQEIFLGRKGKPKKH